MRRLRLVAPTASVVLILAGAPAAATTGNLYELGSSPAWATGSQFSASVANDVWTISAPTLNPALAGSKWEMNWGCPVAGSVIAQVKWSALRTGGASNLEMDVLADGGRIWVNPDAWIPQSPEGGRAYDVGLNTATCNVHLRLVQVSTVFQNPRTYFIDHPRIVVRDLQAPGVAIAAVQGGWINAGQTHSEIRWTTSDNFGSDGVGEQRVLIGGQLHYRAAPGVGTHALNAHLVPVGDGIHQVLVQADGDGTGAGSAAGSIAIDRTAPSASGLAASHTGSPGHATFAATPADGTSGVALTEVEINRATDGSTSGAWAGLATQTGAAALDRPSVRTSVVRDGLHSWRARVADVAGNNGYVAGPAPVVVDTTAPSLALASPPGSYLRTLRVGFTQSDNLQSAIGLGATEFEANEAPDGTAGGAWLPLTSVEAGPGDHVADIDFAALSDGTHLLRGRVRNGGNLGASLFAEQNVTVKVDNTSPAVTNASFTPSAPGRVDVAWIAQDALSGVARAVVQRRDGAGWQTLADEPAGPGAGRLSVDASSLPDGSIDLRLLVFDFAGNVSESLSGGATAVDSTAPSVTDLKLAGGPPWHLSWTQADAGGRLDQAETSVQVSGPGTQGQWREILARKLGSGRHRVSLPVAGLAAGAYRVRVVVRDAVGNQGSAVAGGLLIGGEGIAGASSTAPDPFARFRRATLDLRVSGGRLERRRGRRTFVARLRGGQPLTIQGRLRSKAGRPLGRALLHVRGHGRRIIGRTRTRRNGTFRVRARPVASGLLRVGVPAGRALLPGRASAAIRVLMRPRLTLRASSTAVARGQAVFLRGRMSPTPGRIGGHRRKAIVLEWLDPIRRTWRPVVNGRVQRDGRFAFRWRFGVSGFTVPMRVRVPVERGWPLQAGRSRTVPIAVR